MAKKNAIENALDYKYCVWSSSCTKEPTDSRFHLCCAVCKELKLNKNCLEVCNEYLNGRCKYLVSREFIDDLIERRDLFFKTNPALNKSPSKKSNKQKEQEELQKELQKRQNNV